VPLIALVRPPTASIEAGLRTHIGRSSIDFARAQEQHINYVSALRDAGAQIVALSEAEHLPDAVFIEDTALVLDSLAVMAHSAAQSRRAEAPTVAGALSNYCCLAHLPEGACFDGGDALVIDRTVYLGLTQRTNQPAIDFLKRLLRQYYYETVPVPVTGCLHLKSAVTSLGGNLLLINPQWVPREAFAKHQQIDVAKDEPMGANALCVGNRLLMSASYPQTVKRVEAHGLEPKLIDIGEFHKAEGGLTCLSILLQAA